MCDEASEYGRKPGLFAEFVGGDAIKMGVALDGNSFITVGKDRMICALANEDESLLLKVSNQILALYGHQSSTAIDSIRAALTTGMSFPLSW